MTAIMNLKMEMGIQNTKIKIEIRAKNSLMLSYYTGNDARTIQSKQSLQWGGIQNIASIIMP